MVGRQRTYWTSLVTKWSFQYQEWSISNWVVGQRGSMGASTQPGCWQGPTAEGNTYTAHGTWRSWVASYLVPSPLWTNVLDIRTHSALPKDKAKHQLSYKPFLPGLPSMNEQPANTRWNKPFPLQVALVRVSYRTWSNTQHKWETMIRHSYPPPMLTELYGRLCGMNRRARGVSR